MHIKKFKEIKHLIPQDSWAYWRNEKHKGEFDDEPVFFIDGDAQFENLDLDAPFVAFKDRRENYEAYLEQQACFLILVKGNLKTKNIYNHETDGSTGLIVLGNVQADNMVVGGQEIYITGNLAVNDLFWGEYNHGTLVVKGTVSAGVFVATNEYHFPELIDVEQNNIKVLLIDEYDEEFEFSTLERYFNEEVIFEYTDEECDGSWEYMLQREAIIIDLENNKPVLLTEFAEGKPDIIPQIFDVVKLKNEEDLAVQAKNFDLLFAQPVFHAGETDQAWEESSWTTHLSMPEDNPLASTISAVREDGFSLVMVIFEREERNMLGLREKSLGKQLMIYFVPPGQEKARRLFHDELTYQYLPDIEQYWSNLLTAAEKGIHYKSELEKLVSPQEILEITSLPMVTEKYNDWNDDEKHGDWFGSRVYSFCINGFDDTAATLRIGAEIPSDDFDARYYYFRNDRIENPSKVILKYMSSNETRKNDPYSGESKTVSLFNWQRYKEAISWYKKGIKAVRQVNEIYLKDKEYLAQKQREKEEARKNYNPKKPAEVIHINGIDFKIIDRNEAQELLQNVTDFEGNPLYNVFEMHEYDGDSRSMEKRFFLLAENEITIDKFYLDAEEIRLNSSETDLDTLNVLAYIFREKVNITKCVTAYDLDFSPPLICLSDAQINNALLYGATHYFGKNLQIGTLLGEFENGNIYIKGNLDAKLLLPNNLNVFIGKINSIDALVCDDGKVFAHDTLTYEDNSTKEILLEQWATHRLQDCLLPQFIYKGTRTWELNDELAEFLQEEGNNPLNHDLMEQQKKEFEEHFARDIQQVFQHVQLATLENGKSFSVNKRDGYSHMYYYFIKNEDFWQIGYWNTWSHIVAYAYLMSDGASELTVSYYDDENEYVKYRFASDITDHYTISRVVRRIFKEAMEALNKSEEYNDHNKGEFIERQIFQNIQKEISTENAQKPFNQIIAEIIDILGKLLPEPALNKGVSETNLADLEKMIGKTIPDDFKKFYSICNGQKDTYSVMPEGELLSTERIKDEYHIWKELVEDGEFEENISNSVDQGIQNSWYNLGWLPITSSGGGDNYCIDLNPAEGGTYGQIITMWHDDATRSLIANSFEEWIRNYHQKLSDGDLMFSDEYGGIVDKKEIE